MKKLLYVIAISTMALTAKSQQVGDTITFNLGSGNDGSFVHCQSGIFGAGKTLDASFAGTKTTIEKIKESRGVTYVMARVYYSKKGFWQVWINWNPAIKSKEIETQEKK